MPHYCHAHGCTAKVPPRMFVCSSHWKQLPRKLQQAIYREYRPGQEVDKQPSTRYLAVQQHAVAVLAFKPHDEEAARTSAGYYLNSWRLRLAAIRSGEGDPLPAEPLPPSTVGLEMKDPQEDEDT